jgi:hypothetical protein
VTEQDGFVFLQPPCLAVRFLKSQPTKVGQAENLLLFGPARIELLRARNPLLRGKGRRDRRGSRVPSTRFSQLEIAHHASHRAPGDISGIDG